MQFDVRHTIRGIDVASYERLYLDEAFNTALCLQVGLGRRLISHSDVDGTVTRVLEITPDRQLPKPILKLLGGQQVTYVETLRYVWGSGAGTWNTAPSVMADRVQSDGQISFTAEGPDVVRRVWGHVTVKVFGVGGAIERAIVADVTQSYADAAAFTQTYLAGRS